MVKWLLAGTPRPVQVAAMNKAGMRSRFAHFMEPRLGKTPLIVNEFVNALADGTADYFVSVSPNTLKYTWVDEANQWSDGQLQFNVWPDCASLDHRKTHGSCLNYEALIHKGGEYLDFLLKTYRVFLALDETSKLKNATAAVTRWVLQHAPLAAYVRLANGTPMTENVMDLYPQLRLAGELENVNRFSFRNRYAKMGGWMGKKVVGTQNQDALQAIIDRCAFVAYRKDWSNIREPEYETRRIDMLPAQAKTYAEMLEDFFLQINGQDVAANFVITQGMKLQQISSGFVIDDEGTAHDLVPLAKNPKILATSEIVSDLPGKVVIVAHFKRTIDNLLKVFPDAVCIRGGMTPQAVRLAKVKFNEDPGCRQIVLQGESGKFGHTLVGRPGTTDAVDATIHVETSYSRLSRTQVEARTEIAEQDAASLHIDIVASPVEKKIAEALRRKADASNAIMSALRSFRA